MVSISMTIEQDGYKGSINISREMLELDKKIIVSNNDNYNLTNIKWDFICYAQNNTYTANKPENSYVEPVNNAYVGGVFDDYNGRIYFTPYEQSAESKWQYIDSYDGYTVAYKNNVSLDKRAYINGTYDPINNRIFFCPFEQSNKPVWHFVACDGYKDDYSYGDIVPYLNNIVVENKGYSDLVYEDINDRIYMIPYNQAIKSDFHYIDCYGDYIDEYGDYIDEYECTNVKLVSYDNNFSNEMDSEAYYGGIYDSENKRIYFIPYKQSSKEKWHYINCDANDDYDAGEMVSYKHKTNIYDDYAYAGGVFDPINKRIYFIPYCQATKEIWHYINCDINSDDYDIGEIVSYKHNSDNLLNYAYVGGSYCPTNNRIFFVPYGQTKSDTWHGIDCSKNTVFSYKHGKKNELVENNAYKGSVYDSDNDIIYFVPFAQSKNSIWHYIDCSISGNKLITSYIQNEVFSFIPKEIGTYIIILILNNYIRGTIGAAVNSIKLNLRYSCHGEDDEFNGWYTNLSDNNITIEEHSIFNNVDNQIFSILRKK